MDEHDVHDRVVIDHLLNVWLFLRIHQCEELSQQSLELKIVEENSLLLCLSTKPYFEIVLEHFLLEIL